MYERKGREQGYEVFGTPNGVYGLVIAMKPFISLICVVAMDMLYDNQIPFQ